MTVPIYEILPEGHKVSRYQYLGPNKTGYYVFENEDGAAEWFVRRKSPTADWQLQRGAYYYEFCTSTDPNP